MDELPYPQEHETELVSLPCPDCGQWFEIPVFLDWDDKVKVAEEFAGPYVRAHAEGHPRSVHPDLWTTPHGDVVERRG